MSEYWKSVPRKFCDFCKCWITDNKPSVEFHERGKRHKENVELKLKEIRKKSLESSLQQDQTKAEMDKLEKAALEAFKKDLKDNPELAAQYGVSLEQKPPAKSDSPPTTTEQKNSKEAVAKEWFEAQSPEGYSYYWSNLTGESRWEPPDDYVSLKEQEAAEEQKESETSKEVLTETPAPEEDQVSAAVKRIDPCNSRSAYGAWDVVKEAETVEAYSDNCLPPSLDDIPLPEAGKTAPEQKKSTFKEKTFKSLSSSGEAVAFKKRKIAAGARNVRQKECND